MNRDLFLAILSMDSYNRGYGKSIEGLADTGSIGSASIGVNSSILKGPDNEREDIPAGFYAIAYDVSGIAGIPGGTRVVMYRGSDTFAFGNTWTDGDVLNGYGGAAGDGRIAQLAG